MYSNKGAKGRIESMNETKRKYKSLGSRGKKKLKRRARTLSNTVNAKVGL